MFEWHTYSEHMIDMMHELMTSKDFADVTFITCDEKTIKAHRNILSACSPVFKNILQMEPQNQQPTIYLRGIHKRYGKPGDKITVIGKIFTKEYGNMNWRDDEGKFFEDIWNV